MELIESVELRNSDWYKIYKCEISEFKDLISLMESLAKEYGCLDDILCIKKENNKLISYIEYDSIEEFKNKFNKEELHDYNNYRFSVENRYVDFNYDIDTDKLNIYSNEGTLGKFAYDPNKVSYYQDKYGNIVKYDQNKQMLYTYDNDLDEWIKRRDLRRDFFSYDSEYTLIDYDPQSKTKR